MGVAAERSSYVPSSPIPGNPMLLLDNAEAILPFFFFVFGGGIFCITAIFWIWMLVDAIQNEANDERLLWVLLIIFLPFIGSMLYLFMRKLPRRT